MRIVDALWGGWTIWTDPLGPDDGIQVPIRLRLHMTDSGNIWDARIRASLERVVDEGRWRSPREFDALGPAGLLKVARSSRSRPTTISD